MIPTAFSVIGPSNFQNYWWLRSPYTDRYRFEYAYLVFPSGDVDSSTFSEAYNSYGSPDTNYGNFAGLVDQSSGVYDYGVNITVPYGRLTR